jgi:hypothetical protein
LARSGVTAARLLSSAPSFAGRTLATAADAAGLGGFTTNQAAISARDHQGADAAMSRLVISAGLKLVVVPIDSTCMRRSLGSGPRA